MADPIRLVHTQRGVSYYAQVERRGTRFDIIVTTDLPNVVGDFLTLANFRKSMVLPPYWREAGANIDYLEEKLGIGSVDAESVQMYLKQLAQDLLNAAAEN